MSDMRAKVVCASVHKFETNENLVFNAVCKSGSYPADGSDDDNTYAKFTPSATFALSVTNPALLGKFVPGKKYYVDFTAAD